MQLAWNDEHMRNLTKFIALQRIQIICFHNRLIRPCPRYPYNYRFFSTLPKETKVRVTMKLSEEHAFGMLIAKYGDEETSHAPKMARDMITCIYSPFLT